AVDFADATYNSVANEKGEWEVRLPKLKAGGPFTMIIKGKNELVLNDILIGDVWIASGQSNMEMSMRSVSSKYPEDIATSENKFIRQFAVPRRHIFSKQMKDVTEGSWISADPNTVLRFTAAGYFF